MTRLPSRDHGRRGIAVVGFCAAIAAMQIGLAARASAEIGVAAVVENQVTGQLDGTTRRLAVGDGVVRNEVVATGAASGAHLVFEDRTSLTLGENARIALTTFVYDPAGGATRVVTTAARGAFRFVSGLGQDGGYTVRTPRATIGVRGSIVESLIDPERNVELHILVQGAMEVCAPDCVALSRPGRFVVLTATGTIVGPSVWRGPLLDLRSLTDFYGAFVVEALNVDEQRLLELLEAENFQEGREENQ